MHWAWGHIKEAWRRGAQQGIDWGQTGGHADTTEAIGRKPAIAVRYALEPSQITAAITADTLLSKRQPKIDPLRQPNFDPLEF
jgi:hypothetical protein